MGKTWEERRQPKKHHSGTSEAKGMRPRERRAPTFCPKERSCGSRGDAAGVLSRRCIVAAQPLKMWRGSPRGCDVGRERSPTFKFDKMVNLASVRRAVHVVLLTSLVARVSTCDQGFSVPPASGHPQYCSQDVVISFSTAVLPAQMLQSTNFPGPYLRACMHRRIQFPR